MSKAYTFKEITDILSDAGYTYISGEYKNVFSKLICTDNEGYTVVVVPDKIINKGSESRRFHSSNPYSTSNIKHFLEINKIGCSLCDDSQYINAQSKLKFKCSCGNTFETTFGNLSSGHKTRCDECSKYHRNYTYEDVKRILAQYGYNLIVAEAEYKGITLTDLVCEDNEGYKYVVCFNALTSKKHRRAARYHQSNPYSIYNINIYLDKYTNGEYECVSSEYISKRSPLLIHHKKCGRIFEKSQSNIIRSRCLDNLGANKTGAKCPQCEMENLESAHALVLKQVWLHEKEGTIVEDRSCINPNTNCSLPTDIVNHNEKIAIEIQSWFHDFDDQKAKDKIKKDYWINRGYKFFAVDHRDYSILEMIQIFFPYIKEIPEYIDYNYANKINDFEIQKLLNQGMSVTKVAQTLNYKPHQIYDAIQYGRVSYPENYVNACYKAIVQLDLNGNLIDEFVSCAEAARKTGIRSANIISCMLNKRYYANGYLWYDKKDYDSGNYTLPKFRQSDFYVPVKQYDTKGNYIRSYETIIKAGKDNNISNTDILRVVNGERRSTHGFIFKKSIIDSPETAGCV